MSDTIRLLKQYFGHASFRKGQKELIDALLAEQDVLGVMPTGAGKSVCYQLPAMMLSGMTLVISPLISLMKDQVAALLQMGIPAAYLNSSMSQEEYLETLLEAQMGAYKILYVAPERLTTGAFIGLCRHVSISLVAIDEAHCVSQWGQDFRPSYLKITGFIAGLNQRPVVGAFTATATAQVKTDIKKLLELRNPLEITTGFDRPNLYFCVIHADNKIGYLRKYLSAHRNQSGIIYCATRKGVEAVCGHLRNHGFSAVRYHAGLSDKERRENQEAFVFDRAQVMVATNAFGMGIDKSNVSFVIHYNMPKNLESYYQEAGRAGRDGSPAECILLFSSTDIQTAKYLILNTAENEALTPEEREIVQTQDLKRLEQMISYCRTNDCLRKTLLSYFGEDATDHCGRCGNCNQEIVLQDITIEAQKILSAVVRVNRRYPFGIGATLIVRMLHGSKEKRIAQFGLDKLSTYGIMRDVNRQQIRAYIDHLLQESYLESSGDEYAVLSATEKAYDVLFHGQKVMMPVKRKQPAMDLKKEKTVNTAETQQALFDNLRELRLQLAKRKHVPAYVILSNASLMDMAQKRPHTRAELIEVSGIGEVKAQLYGEAFLKAIQEWESQSITIDETKPHH